MLRDICDRHGVLLIADEVITGWGRTGKWFAMEHWNVVPDLMTMAKGITSGYFPVGACVARDTVFEEFKGGPEKTYRHGITYGGHPAGGAAGLANAAILGAGRTDSQLGTHGRAAAGAIGIALRPPHRRRRSRPRADVRRGVGNGQGIGKRCWLTCRGPWRH